MGDAAPILFEERDSIATLTLNRPERRNPLSRSVMLELRDQLRAIGASKARGVVLAANGPVFSAGHDYADMVNRDLAGMRELLAVCTELMTAVQSIPQPVVARVQGLATGAGCQLVAACDLAVASEDAEFQTPGGRGRPVLHHAHGERVARHRAQARPRDAVHGRQARRAHGSRLGAREPGRARGRAGRRDRRADPPRDPRQRVLEGPGSRPTTRRSTSTSPRPTPTPSR